MLPYLWMLIGSAAFTVMTTCVYALGRNCDWQVVAAVRTGLAMVFAGTLVWLAGVKFVVWRPPLLWLRSLTGSVSLACNFYAMTRLPVADVLTLTNTFPLWVAVLSWPLEGVPPRRETWVAIALGLFGVVLVQQPYLAAGNLATLVALFSALTTAVALLGLHRLQGVDPRAVVVHFSGVSFLFSLLLVGVLPARADRTHLAEPSTLLWFLGLGISATIGQLMLTKAFAAGHPAKVSVVGLSQVGFAVLLDMLLWNRHINGLTALGISCVLAPTAWLLWRRDAHVETVPPESGAVETVRSTLPEPGAAPSSSPLIASKDQS